MPENSLYTIITPQENFSFVFVLILDIVLKLSHKIHKKLINYLILVWKIGVAAGGGQLVPLL